MNSKESLRKLISLLNLLLEQGNGLCEKLLFGSVAGYSQRGSFSGKGNKGKLIVFILSGSCYADYMDVSQTKRRASLAPGTVLYLGRAPYLQYFESSCERIGISVEGLRLSLSYSCYRKGEAYPNCPDIFLRGSIAGSSELEDLFAIMDKRSLAPERTDSFTCSVPRLLILSLLEYFQRKPVLRQESVGGARWTQLRSYLESNYSQQLNRKKVAAKFNLSEDGLSRLLKKRTGLTFSKALLKLRMAHAKEMLLAGDFSVKETAYCCGYRDFSYFTKTFKRHFNVLPGAIASQGSECLAEDLSSFRKR